jgi:thiamine biosynthesis lipoprotein ApbE
MSGGAVNQYTFSTMNSTATLTFSTARDPEEIAAAVQSVFEQYDRRFSRDCDPASPGSPTNSRQAMTAMALGSAGGFLDAAGIENWALALDGDVFVAGERAVDEPWEVFVEDGSQVPAPLAILKLVPPRRASTTMRISNGSPESHDLVQVTVIADDILSADQASEDVLSGGVEQFSQLSSKWEVDAIAIDRSGSVHLTGGAFAAVSSGRNG